MNVSPLFLALILGLILIVSLGSNAYATDFFKGRAVGIEISKSCQLSSNCVSYSDIASLDNSNPRYFGKMNHDGKRIMSPYTDMWQALNLGGGFTVFVDPPPQTKLHIPIITIDTQVPAYFLPTQMKVMELKDGKYTKATQTIRSISHTRFVNDTCTKAIITSENWRSVLPDTISFMYHNCDPNFTKIKTVTNDIKGVTKHDLGTSYKTKLDNYFSYVKKNCIDSFGKCAPTDPSLYDEDERISKKIVLRLSG